jgi:putative phosphoribosyl transferase
MGRILGTTVVHARNISANRWKDVLGHDGARSSSGGSMRFRDRSDAGCQLATRLQADQLRDPVVLALPRGGVPVAFEIARAMNAPLDVLVVRKVGAPQHREFGIGAIAEGGVTVRDEAAMRMVGVSPDRFDQLAEEERRELDRRVRLYRGDRALPDVADVDVVLVDDGLATGVTAEAAIAAVASLAARRVVLAAPVSAADTASRLSALADVVCLATPARFSAVGEWYEEFGQTTDQEVIELLRRAADFD